MQAVEMPRIENQLRLPHEKAHILPFLWMHGEDTQTIEAYLQAMHDVGICEVCLESRPFKGFLEDPWWQELDVIFGCCDRLGMRVWILDDEHFPTGYAAGAIQDAHPELAKQFLQCRSLDVVGPQKRAHICTTWLFDERPDVMAVGAECGDSLANREVGKRHHVYGVYIARRTGLGSIDLATVENVTGKLRGDTLIWDIPEGEWSVLGISSTYSGGEEATKGYLNPLVPEATDVLLDTVYESHYRRYASRFGSTIRGFFSDEPRFGNIKGPNAVMGTSGMALPWRDGLEVELAAAMGLGTAELLDFLPQLFKGSSNDTHAIRYAYMNMVSRLFSENFSQRIAAWCDAHGVEHIGHVLEDNNAHARLGYGPGHFFRSMSGQSMAGMDFVLHQLLPGMDSGYFSSYTSTGWDGEFFTYALARMCASAAEFDERKRGDAFCEVFGAYGWAEGLRFMKWMVDHLFSRGVNHFVPHAFNMGAFPDADCPPHFYAGGNDSEFGAMRVLNTYVEQVATVLSGGRHVSSVAVLYHAEAEWSGECMLLQKPARVLIEHQVEFDVVSADMLAAANIDAKHGAFFVAGHAFMTLVVPYAQRLPERVLARLVAYAEAGVRVLFVGGFPSGLSDSSDQLGPVLRDVQQTCSVVSLNELVDGLADAKQLELISPCRSLRSYQYWRDGYPVIMLFNEDYHTPIRMKFRLPGEESLVCWRPLDGTISDEIAPGSLVDMQLAPSESVLLVPETFVCARKEHAKMGEARSLATNEWTVSVIDGLGCDVGVLYRGAGLPDIDGDERLGTFSGTLRFETMLVDVPSCFELVLEQANEVVTVSIDGRCVGTRIAPPYRFHCDGVEAGSEVVLQIDVTNNLGRNQQDYLSQFMPLDPLGITGDVVIQLGTVPN